MNDNSSGRSSKIVLFLVMLFGLALLAMGRLDNVTNAGVFGLIYVGALLNRFDSRLKNYKANISAAGVTASLESTSGPGDDDDEEAPPPLAAHFDKLPAAAGGSANA